MGVKVASIIILFLLISPETLPSISDFNFKLNNGKTLYVGGNGEGNYTSIQDAINDAMPGDTIIIYYNVYHENVTIDKSLYLIGIEKEGKKPVILGNGSFALKITANNCTLKNLEIRLEADSTVEIYSSFNWIENCHIINFPKKLDGGYECGYALYMSHSNYNRIENSIIETQKESCGIAIRMYRCIGNKFMYNKIAGGTDYDSIEIIEGGEHTFLNNSIRSLESLTSYKNEYRFNKFSSELFIYDCKDSILENNTFKGVKLYYCVNLTLKNNIFYGNLDFLGNKLVYFNSHNIENNIKYPGLPIFYCKNKPNKNISGRFGQIILVNCNDSNIKNVKISGSSIAIFVIYSNNVFIYNCSVSYGKKDVGYGIMVHYSKNCKIEGNNLSEMKESIQVYSSQDIRIVENRIEKTRWAIVVSHSHHTVIERNLIRDSDDGIIITKSWYTLIARNELRKNYISIEYESSLSSIAIRNNLRAVFIMHSFLNIFCRNHWENWFLPFPKPILCVLFYIPWVIVVFYIIFDFCPRIIPYHIS